MSDIIECMQEIACHDDAYWAVCEEAAAEIKRLEEALAEARNGRDAKLHSLTVENAQLKASKDYWEKEVLALRQTVDFVVRQAWREDPPNANNKLTDSERLSVIKFYPTIKERGRP